MNDRIKRVAIAICGRERGADGQCKACREAQYAYNPDTKEDEFTNLGEGCLGFGYECLVVAVDAADKP